MLSYPIGLGSLLFISMVHANYKRKIHKYMSVKKKISYLTCNSGIRTYVTAQISEPFIFRHFEESDWVSGLIIEVSGILAK